MGSTCEVQSKFGHVVLKIYLCPRVKSIVNLGFCSYQPKKKQTNKQNKKRSFCLTQFAQFCIDGKKKPIISSIP